MKIAIYKSEKHPAPTVLDEDWGSLAELLADFKETPCAPCTGKSCASKFGLAWSPVEIEGTRLNENVRSITAAVFDLDHLTAAQLEDVARRIEGFEYVVHSTHSHRPPDDQCLRLVIPLSRPALPSEWAQVFGAAVDFLAIPADPSCKDLARLYFLPSVAAGEARLYARGEGHTLDVDALLTHAKAPTSEGDDEEAQSLAAEGVELQEAAALDYGALRERLVEVRRSYAHSTRAGADLRHELIDNVLNGVALAADGKRSVSVNKTAAIVACALPKSTPAEACIELMRASIGAMVLAPEGLDHWLTVARTSYERAMRRRIEREAALAELNAAIKQRLIGSQTTPIPAADGEVVTNWAARIISNADGSIKNCGFNIGLILQHGDEVRGTLRFNEVKKSVDVFGGPFASEPTQTLHVGVANWFQEQLGVNAKAQEVKEQIARVARLNAYDPLAEHLRGLAWDGTPRLDTALETYFGASTVDAEGGDIRPYLRMIGPKWFISAVARALTPGSKVDTVLVVEGKQGIKKSTAFAVLGGAFFCDTQLKIGDKDSTMLAARSWIIELAELAAMKRSETESQKAFITRRADAIRPPYGHIVEDFPRRAVFVGTTNDTEYLVDPTGNRRFWPVLALRIDIVALERDAAQLWAEAVKRFNAGERWWLDDAEAQVAEAQAAERFSESPLVEQISEWWYGLAPARRAKSLGTQEIAVAVLMLTADRVTRHVEGEIGKALQRLGFSRTRIRVNGRLAYRYAASEELLTAPQGKPAHLRLIANAPTPAQSKGQ
jgi:predicted P-loop ATPase